MMAGLIGVAMGFLCLLVPPVGIPLTLLAAWYYWGK